MIFTRRILLTISHDFIVLCFSFFLALWLRLEGQSYSILSLLWPYLIAFSVITIFFLNRFGLYYGIWRYASLEEISSIVKSLIASCLIILASLFLSIRLENIPRSFPLLLFIVSVFTLSGPRLLYRIFKDNITKNKVSKISNKISVIVVGEGDTAELFIRATKRDDSPYKVIGIIGLKFKSINRRIHGVPIVSVINDQKKMLEDLKKIKISPQRIIIADHSLSKKNIESLFILAKKNGLAIGELPKITDFKSNSLSNFKTTPIVIEDVLGRKQKVNDTSNIKNIKNKIILITGAGGSIGSELSKQLQELEPKKIILFEQNEYLLYKIFEKIKNKNIYPIIGDIRDKRKLEKIIIQEKPNIIFHSAALKHITFVESDPLEAILTNFIGTVNICELCQKNNISQMIFISSDKAVNPTNIMGATKRLCEKYIQTFSIKSNTNFKIVRFGNVLGSTGSVIPLFQKQIQMGGPITVTSPNVSRYFMTIREAVELVIIASSKNQENGTINILEMGKPIKIKDLAIKMIKLSGEKTKDIKIEFTSLRKAEKLHEELFYKNESFIKNNNLSIFETKSRVFPITKLQIESFINKVFNAEEKDIIGEFKKLLPEYKQIK